MIINLKQTQIKNTPHPRDNKFAVPQLPKTANTCTLPSLQPLWPFTAGDGGPRGPAGQWQTPLKARQHESGYRGEAPALYSETPVSSLTL